MLSPEEKFHCALQIPKTLSLRMMGVVQSSGRWAGALRNSPTITFTHTTFLKNLYIALQPLFSALFSETLSPFSPPLLSPTFTPPTPSHTFSLVALIYFFLFSIFIS